MGEEVNLNNLPFNYQMETCSFFCLITKQKSIQLSPLYSVSERYCFYTKRQIMFNKLVTFLIVAILISGCKSMGNENLRNENQISLDQKIVNGKTTKAQVTQALGGADEVSFTDSGNEIWKYRHTIATAKAINLVPVANLFAAGQNETKKELMVLFNKSGIVTNHTYALTNSEVRTGVFAG